MEERKLHWLVRLALWLHKKLVIDRIKLDVNDISFRPATNEEMERSKRLVNVMMDSRQMSSKIILASDYFAPNNK